MNKKMKIAGIFNISAAAFSVLSLGFILLDIAVLKLVLHQTQGWDGVGVALIFALSLAIEYPATLVNLVFQGISGGIALSYPKKEKGVHKALRVIAWIVGIVAAGVHAFFAITYLNAGLILWGTLIALTAASSVVAPIFTTIAHKQIEAVEN